MTLTERPDADDGIEASDLTDVEVVAPRRVPAINLIVLGLLTFVCAIGVVLVAASITDPHEVPAVGSGPAPSTPTASPASEAAVAAVRARPHVTFRSTALGPTYGSVGLAPIGDDGTADTGAPVGSGLTCERFAEGGDRGLCLIAERGALTSYRASVVDERYQELFSFDLPGEPSRARVSPDGRYGSLTAFVTGHAYSDVGFSTFTEIVDLRSGESLGDLEQFTLRRDGAVVDAVDRNFWGVTFAHDDRTFYATAATGGETYLVVGDLAARTMTTVRTGVECPSLSPDSTRIAFKQRVTGDLGQVSWRLAVLDLATGTITPTAETRSVDDQPEWLDDRTLLYGLPEDAEGSPVTDVWAVPADGSGTPTRLLAGAWSPTTSPGR